MNSDDLKNALGTITAAIKQIEAKRDEIYAQLSPEQKKLFNEFQSNIIAAKRSNNENEVQELVEKCKKDNDELQRNTAKVQQRVPKWYDFFNKSYNRFFRRSKG